MRQFQSILVTGGAGFIGSNFIRYLFKETGFAGRVVNFDKLTYAGNPESLDDIRREYGPRYAFEQGDICDGELTLEVLTKHRIDAVVHFAAESHVDRSILGPGEFIKTNIDGTFTLLESVRAFWKDRQDVVFHHVSTDEVYGSLGDDGYFTEETPYDPRSPYSASKASSDHLVSAYFHTYHLPVTKSNCSNNYGPYHFPEKLIPLMIRKIQNGEPLPVYGDGSNVRDWLYVVDHAEAIWTIVTQGRLGETYNVGGENEWQNLKLVQVLCETMARATGKDPLRVKELITFVKDRPGHDRRYAIDCSKIKKELGWKPKTTFEEGLKKTVEWYLSNPQWIEHVTSGAYRNWMRQNYSDR
jgi:dTDP-glucose 4,6-dehydratase